MHEMWLKPYGFPTLLTSDRGVHNRGVFANYLSSCGVHCRTAGLESPEQIGIAERHQGILKHLIESTVRQTGSIGKHKMNLVISECCIIKNEELRTGGFSPAQWVLGKQPRGVSRMLDEDELGQIGMFNSMGTADPQTEFGMRAQLKHAARKAFVQRDCSVKVARALTRNARPLTLKLVTLSATERSKSRLVNPSNLVSQETG